MGSNSEDYNSDVDSSEEESLSALKRKGIIASRACSMKKPKYCEDSDDDVPLLPQVFVKVEVEELDEPVAHYDSSASDKDFPEPKSSKTKKTRKPPPPVAKPKPVVNKKKFECQQCDAVFEKACDLKAHGVEHQVETRHKCEQCGRCFKKAFSLRLHMRSHMEKVVKCPICDDTCTSKNALSRHMLMHERTVKCQYCSALFHTPRQLKVHCSNQHRDVATGRNGHSRRKDQTITSESEDLPPEPHVILLEKEVDTKNGTQETNSMDSSNSFEYMGYLKKDDLSYPTQCSIVSKMHKGRSIADICELYNLTPEVVNEIWEDREKYEIPKKVGKKTTKYMNSVIDQRIVDWFNLQKENNVQVTGKMLQDTAEAIAKECGFVAFNGSKKWLDRFKQRYRICLKWGPRREINMKSNIRRENSGNPSIVQNSSDSKWKTLFFKEQWLDASLGIADENIYTADEVGFYYNPSKGRIKKLGGKKYIQGYAKDRLSIFVCTNVFGTDKKKLLVCGTEDPLIRSCRDPRTLPVTYIRHSQAHFTTRMFEEYVKCWNEELLALDKKALLILDRATIHSKLNLSNLKLVFVPWKAANSLMPVKNGIYARFREEYRKLFLQEKALNAVRGIDRNTTCLEALNMVNKAWVRTPPEVIFKSFIDTGFNIEKKEDLNIPVNIPKVSDNDEELLVQVLRDYDVETYYTEMPSLDNYIQVDDEFLTGQGTNASVFGGNHKVIDPQKIKDDEEMLPIGTEKPEVNNKEMFIKKSRALQDLEIVKKYLQTNDTAYETYCCFMDMESFFCK